MTLREGQHSYIHIWPGALTRNYCTMHRFTWEGILRFVSEVPAITRKVDFLPVYWQSTRQRTIALMQYFAEKAFRERSRMRASLSSFWTWPAWPFILFLTFIWHAGRRG